MPRVLSLLPAATDIVAALGRAADLVGVSGECTVPPGARPDLAVVTTDALGAADPTDPAQVDAAVRAAGEARRALSILDEAAVAALHPEVILTQDLCRVCAVPAGDVATALARIGCAAEVVQLDPGTLDDVLDVVVQVGAALGAGEQATAVVGALTARLATVAQAVAGRPRPRVLVLEWVDPPFTAGHWIPDLVRAAGGDPVLGRPGAPSVATRWDRIATVQADHVVVAPCGFGVHGARAQAAAVLHRLPLGAAVWAVDADRLIVRSGPALVTGVEVLAALLHPEAGLVWPAREDAQRVVPAGVLAD